MISFLREALNQPLKGMASDGNTQWALHGPLDQLTHDTRWVHTSQPSIQTAPPRTISVVFSGGPAPGGHDILAGILANLRPQDTLIGWLNGFGGLLKGNHRVIQPSDKDLLVGTAGFDFLGTDRTKLKDTGDFLQVKHQLTSVNCEALLVVGGDDSNTNAAHLADALGPSFSVVGIPKTIDGDLVMGDDLPVTFGFHTATQHYATLVQSLRVDAQATGKYFHVVKLMGRHASHVTLEVAHATHPHGVVLSEEIMANNWGMAQLVDYFSGVVTERVQLGRPYGVLLFPEGIVEVLPEWQAYLAGDGGPLNDYLASWSLALPNHQDVHEDGHGNKNVSRIGIETILVACLVAKAEANGQRSVGFLPHFFGYTGRSVCPSEFDHVYAQLLGKTALELVLSHVTGMMASVHMSDAGVVPCGIPLRAMMGFDAKKSRWLIQKHLVDTKGDDYMDYDEQKSQWAANDPTFPRYQSADVPRRLLTKRRQL